MAQVGTDSATIYAIAPEMLAWVIDEGEWHDLVKQNDWMNPRLEKIIREHGGAVFNTGADGYWEVDLSGNPWSRGNVKGKGAIKPYGTPESHDIYKKRVEEREKTARTYQINIDDLVLYGKYKNKKGRVVGFGTDDKGQPTIEIEPIPKGRKQNKVLTLFKVRYVKEAADLRDLIVDLYLGIGRVAGKSVVDAYRWKNTKGEIKVLKAILQGIKGLPKYPLAWKLFQSRVNKIYLGEPYGTEDARWDPGGALKLMLKPDDRTQYSPVIWRFRIIHELGHALEDDAQIDYFEGIYGKPPYVSAYAEMNASEDFAETFRALNEEPRKLKQVAPAKYVDMRARVLGKVAKEITVNKLAKRVAARYLKKAGPPIRGGFYQVMLVKSRMWLIGRDEWEPYDGHEVWSFRTPSIDTLLESPRIKRLIQQTRGWDWEWEADDYLQTGDYRQFGHTEPMPEKDWRPPFVPEELAISYSLHIESHGIDPDWTENPVEERKLLRAFNAKKT